MVVEDVDEVLSVALVDHCTIDVARVLKEVDIAVLVDERLEQLDSSGVDTVGILFE